MDAITLSDTSRKSTTIQIPGKLANKANHYEIRINPQLWKVIRSATEQWKKNNPKARPWWIGPSDDVKSFQEAAAWIIKSQSTEKFGTDPVAVSLTLIQQSTDVDAVKAIIDAIQDSGIIENDRQIRAITIRHEERKGQQSSIELRISRI